MVLEGLFDIREIRKNPSTLFFVGVIATLIATLITYFLFQGGIFLTFLIVLAVFPIIFRQLRLEERKKEYDHFYDYLYRLNFFRRHETLIVEYFYLIFGISLTIATLYILLPNGITEKIFSEQLSTISSIRGNFMNPDFFMKILINNIGVMLICFIFSLFYSSGAIFLISWNSTVLGVVVGKEAMKLLGISSVPFVLLSYLPHGIFEFAGYICTGIAGGLLSIALTRHKESRRHFYFVLKDSMTLLILGVIFIIIGAIIESLLI
ncbi:MAG: hypothetical protein B6U88_01815 [Candidatus Aenigmarchaeota archaeon ex4484_56]|nr:MAG: hypothetical protein B6U88_01815 [Candidatus Aenigmarchaeota archaeon ex4484_56]